MRKHFLLFILVAICHSSLAQSGRSVSINTSGWKKGLYAARATIDKEVLTEKIQVR